jgi:hypothetical protein
MGLIADAWSRDSLPPRLVKAFASRVTHVSPPQVSAAQYLVARKISFHHSADHFSQICTLIPVTEAQTRINGEPASIPFRWPAFRVECVTLWNGVATRTVQFIKKPPVAPYF